MAKCIGSVTSWSTKPLDTPVPTFANSDIRVGEDLIRIHIDKYSDIMFEIANTYLSIERSALNTIDKIDCNRAQELVISRLENFYSVTNAVIKQFCSSSIARYIKQRYYILYSVGVIEKLKNLLMIVGRLSELNQSIYSSEQRKRMISEESITIHTLTAIWSAATTIMFSFRESADEIFMPESGEPDDDYKYLIENLESFVSGIEQARIFAMDLTITSWIQFNRLVKYDDLLNGLPFLCLCHSKIYFSMLEIALTNQSSDRQHFLKESLSLMVDYQSKPSSNTSSVREYNLIPFEVCYSDASKEERSYFVLWHVYSLFKRASDSQKDLFRKCCDQILQDNFNSAMSSFVDKTQSSNNEPTQSQPKLWLSPHQGERFKLVLSMINRTFEKDKTFLGILVKLFTYFDNYWHLFGTSYYDNQEFTIDGLTIFQLLAKLMNDVIPMYTMDGQPRLVSSDQCKSKEEKQMLLLWDQLLLKSKQLEAPKQTPKPARPCCSDTNEQLE